MRAATVTEYGGTPTVTEIPTPEAGPGQILIKLRAAGTNPMDLWLASGAWKPMPATFPMVLGADGAGIVEKLGEGTSMYSGGEHLFGRCWSLRLARRVPTPSTWPLARMRRSHEFQVDSTTLSPQRCPRRAAPGSPLSTSS